MSGRYPAGLYARNMEDHYVSIGILSQLLQYLRYLKISPERVLSGAGIDPDILSLSDSRISFANYIAAENKAAEISGDMYFGLHMGEFITPGHYNIVGYMMMSSSSLGEAMVKLGRYNRLIGTLITGKIQPGLKKSKLMLIVPGNAPGLSRHCVECAAASILTLARHLTGERIRPAAAGFAHPSPGPADEYGRIFGVPVLFNRKETFLLLDNSVGKIPVLQPDSELLAYFEKYARSYLEDIEETRDLVSVVIKKIMANLSRKRLGLGTIAGEMSMSVRTLQNRLKEEGVIFRELLEGTRKGLAARYLRENHVLEEIAYMLGYSEAGAFGKAFKKWYGVPPHQYRMTGFDNSCAD